MHTKNSERPKIYTFFCNEKMMGTRSWNNAYFIITGQIIKNSFA